MTKLLAVASGGGHWTQLSIISESFSESDTYFMTTKANPVTNHRSDGSPVIKVIQADFSQKRRLLIMALQIAYHIIRLRPDAVISTGAAPGFFAIVSAKCIGAKTIWVDSIANYERPSLSGVKVKPFCDVFLTQWPHLKDQADYWGRII